MSKWETLDNPLGMVDVLPKSEDGPEFAVTMVPGAVLRPVAFHVAGRMRALTLDEARHVRDVLDRAIDARES